MTGSVHIHRPATAWIRSDHPCPICGYSVGLLGYYAAWYSTMWTCLACGDQFGDGEIMERPFMRGWRLKNVQSAQRGYEAWVAAGSPPASPL